MKLNNKRTVLVGLAFLSICSFWQMYDNVVPLILTKTFHLNETFSGGIMAADNILALFLLPFFGTLSDRTNTKIGKRTPYILLGTAAADPSVTGYKDANEIAAKFAKLQDKVYTPDPEKVAVYDKLYAEYNTLLDYFGRGGNDVMKRLNRIREENK